MLRHSSAVHCSCSGPQPSKQPGQGKHCYRVHVHQQRAARHAVTGTVPLPWPVATWRRVAAAEPNAVHIPPPQAPAPPRPRSYGNLVTDSYLGAGTRPFVSGGAPGKGARCGSYQTFWGIRADAPLAPPQRDPGPGRVAFGPDLNFVGAGLSDAKSTAANWHIERIPSGQLQPRDIYEAMRARRLRVGGYCRAPGGADAAAGARAEWRA